MLGVWDSDLVPPKDFSLKDVGKLAERLIPIPTGADGGGYIDVYIDESMPKYVERFASDVLGETTISESSGRLIVAGAESFHRGEQPNSKNSLELPPGRYAIKISVIGDDADDYFSRNTEKELAESVGTESVEFFDKTNARVLISGVLSTIAVFAAALAFSKWYWAVISAVVWFVLWFNILSMILERSPRYKKLSETIAEYRLANEPPTFVIELRRMK